MLTGKIKEERKRKKTFKLTFQLKISNDGTPFFQKFPKKFPNRFLFYRWNLPGKVTNRNGGKLDTDRLEVEKGKNLKLENFFPFFWVICGKKSQGKWIKKKDFGQFRKLSKGGEFKIWD
jgi:hypothetical protein